MSAETRALLSRVAGYRANGPAHVSEDLAHLMDLDNARDAAQRLAQINRDLDNEPISPSI